MAEQHIELTTAAGNVLEARRLRVREGLSELGAVTVWAVSKDDSVDLEAIVGEDASVTLQTGYAKALTTRTWSGVVARAEQTEAESTGLSSYVVTIVPRLHLSGLNRKYRIFQNKTLNNILQTVLSEASPSLELSGGPPFDHRTQYGESDLTFACRLMEEMGVSFITFHQGGGLVLTDDVASRAEDLGEVDYVQQPNEAAEQAFVTELTASRSKRSSEARYLGYDFLKPAQLPEGKQKGAKLAPGTQQTVTHYVEEHDNPSLTAGQTGAGGGDFPGLLKKRAAVTIESLRSSRRVIEARTNMATVAPGAKLKVGSHPHSEVGGKTFVVTHVSIDYTIGRELDIRFEGTREEDPVRPAQKTPKPRVPAVETAEVVTTGDEIFVDEFGRVKVAFKWDEQASVQANYCWLRVSQPWSGEGWGFLAHPRKGQEVVVSYLHDDVDQPIVVGRVHNKLQPVPYTLPDHSTRTVWRSRSSPGGSASNYNELTFEDKKGSELVFAQAEKDDKKLVKNDQQLTVGHDRTALVKNDLREHVVNDRKETTDGNRVVVTTKNHDFAVKADATDLVKGKRSVETGGDKKEAVLGTSHFDVTGERCDTQSADWHRKTQGALNESVLGKLSLQVTGDIDVKTSGSEAHEATSAVYVKAGTTIVLEASAGITLKVGGNFVSITTAGVDIVGTMVKINSGGAALSGKAPSPTSATAASCPGLAVPEVAAAVEVVSLTS
jgi:type VI secretion system secreted protein VgrG